MESDSKAFHKKWFIIFIFMYLLIMLPFSFFYSSDYIPSIAGIPSFVFGWFVHTAVTYALIYLYYQQAMQRKEYREFDGEEVDEP